MAPRMLPLNHIINSYFIEMRISKYLHSPTKSEGRNTPMALARMHEMRIANIKLELNFSCSIP